MRFSLKSYLLLVTALGGSSVFVQDANASISANVNCATDVCPYSSTLKTVILFSVQYFVSI